MELLLLCVIIFLLNVSDFSSAITYNKGKCQTLSIFFSGVLLCMPSSLMVEIIFYSTSSLPYLPIFSRYYLLYSGPEVSNNIIVTLLLVSCVHGDFSFVMYFVIYKA